jgi:hypothetical protein
MTIIGNDSVDEAQVAGSDDPRDSEAEEANNKLNAGLKSCRAVVSNYRALLEKKRTKKEARLAGSADLPDREIEGRRD